MSQCRRKVERASATSVDRESLFHVFDAVDDELLDLYYALFESTDKGAEWRPDLLDSANGLDILYIERVEILPRFWGFGIGLQVVKRVMDTFGGGAAITVLEPCPIEYGERGLAKKERGDWVERMEVERLRKPLPKAKKSLAEYWQKLGFGPIPGTHRRFYYVDMSWV